MYQKATLDNGLRVLTMAMPHTRSVSIAVFVGVGSRYESEKLSGTSHFIEHMLFKGTDKRPTAQDIANAIEGIGGIFNANTGRELTVYWAKVAQPHLDVALDVLTDMLLHSRFDREEIEKERQVIIEEINMSHDSPDGLAHLLVNRLTWPDHPVGRDVAGSRETVGTVGEEDLLAYMRRNYRPTNTVISLAGRIEHEEIVDRIATLLGSWAGNGSADSFEPITDEQSQSRLHVHRKDTEQAQICLNLPGLPRLHPDRFVLRVLNTILGEGMSSRLFQEIREKRGLAYAVDSYVSALQDTGVVGVYAGVDPAQASQAVRAILGELARFRHELVEGDELDRAKEFTKGRLMLSMEDTFSVAAWYGQQEALGPEVLSVDDVVAAVEAVTLADIQRVANELFVSHRLNLAVVGPFDSENDFRDVLTL